VTNRDSERKEGKREGGRKGGREGSYRAIASQRLPRPQKGKRKSTSRQDWPPFWVREEEEARRGRREGWEIVRST